VGDDKDNEGDDYTEEVVCISKAYWILAMEENSGSTAHFEAGNRGWKRSVRCPLKNTAINDLMPDSTLDSKQSTDASGTCLSEVETKDSTADYDSGHVSSSAMH
jgi:hypothetical protein